MAPPSLLTGRHCCRLQARGDNPVGPTLRRNPIIAKAPPTSAHRTDYRVRTVSIPRTCLPEPQALRVFARPSSHKKTGPLRAQLPCWNSFQTLPKNGFVPETITRSRFKMRDCGFRQVRVRDQWLDARMSTGACQRIRMTGFYSWPVNADCTGLGYTQCAPTRFSTRARIHGRTHPRTHLSRFDTSRKGRRPGRVDSR